MNPSLLIALDAMLEFCLVAGPLAIIGIGTLILEARK
jgi:hypothetical protein